MPDPAKPEHEVHAEIKAAFDEIAHESHRMAAGGHIDPCAGLKRLTPIFDRLAGLLGMAAAFPGVPPWLGAGAAGMKGAQSLMRRVCPDEPAAAESAA